MSKHKLDGAVEVDVTSVTSEFRGRAPEIEGVDRDRMLRFGRPKVIDPIVDIKFKFKATKHDSSIMFGVKQIVVIKEYQALYAGLKDIDGSISLESSGFNNVGFLDISPTSLNGLWDASNNSTGTSVVAYHAPFYSESPSLVRPGIEVELGIVDDPGGGSLRLELQNGATDRPNFLTRFKRSEEFVTALIAAKFDARGRALFHTPLEGVRWRAQTFASTSWNGNTATLERSMRQATKIAELQTISSSDNEFDIFRNCL